MDDAIMLWLEDEAATAQLGADIAMALQPGDVLALSGGLGAGKTTLARGLLRQLAGDDALDVPSPTYTLCQTYDLRVPVAHYDFYRLGDASELDELGLDEAVATGIVLVEWPQRGAGRLPEAIVTVALADRDGGRSATIGPIDAPAGRRVARSLAIRGFLDRHWGRGSRRRFLQGDASARRYETATRDGETRILMDSPKRPDGPPIRDGLPYSRIAHLAEDVVAFIAVDEALRGQGFAAPAIHASSIHEGLILLEHLGSETLLDGDGRPVPERYVQAARLLGQLHARQWPARLTGADSEGDPYVHDIAAYDTGAMLIEAELLLDWYVPTFLPEGIADDERARFNAIWTGLAETVRTSMPTLVLRDYHSPNLIWRQAEPFPRNPGLIDFQDAVIGPAAYDVASLAQDARVDISPGLEAAIVDAYIGERMATDGNFDGKAFSRDFAVMCAQRATKILGIFVRLDRRDGKPDYLRHLPRLRAYLARSLAHPALAEYRGWCERTGTILPS